MWTLLLVFATGSPALLQAAPVQGSSGRCSVAGVFLVEGTSRYSLTFQQALELCQSFDYKLATQEQVNDAYKKGLRTCRFGWIDGQNVMFLPHVNGPNCDYSSTEITFHPEAAGYLSDVYCFNPSDASLNCEDNGKSNSEDLTNGNTATASKFPRYIIQYVKSSSLITNVSSAGTQSGQEKKDGPSTLLIIFAFCVVVGVIVCILVAIATRDKWYGPRQSRNITTEVHNKDYSKSETLPLSEKEQEIVALMSVATLKNGKMEDIAACLDEHEKEYLM
ncbi:lymphatic vessel endothelial hyaluronic acid receptor 1-like [Sinocyclocheilus rhinocerous]|uniref:lymphatic vessel endothelial hyaluronic acid receptor 1-like n=1 Tax=Sinocyclocheilus rhinocerous TaxID=307959 RepID=UPI0007B8D8CB|nr:PREDICTED: lymphatic vessel endothelial hyaluronic acid receptor 1-like [Sinocyclocheilus rhinocerous]